MTEASAAFRRTRWCRPTGSVCSPGRIRADSIGASASHNALPVSTVASCPPCRDRRAHHRSTSSLVSRMRCTRGVDLRDLVANREEAVELLAQLLHARRRSGVVDHLEGFGERPVADSQTHLVGTRQHERSSVRLLPGLVAAQPHRAGIPQIPDEAVDAVAHRHPRTRVEGLVLVAQVVVAGRLRAELPDEGTAGSRGTRWRGTAAGRHRRPTRRPRPRSPPRHPSRRWPHSPAGGSRRSRRPERPRPHRGTSAEPDRIRPASRRRWPAGRVRCCSPCLPSAVMKSMTPGSRRQAGRGAYSSAGAAPPAASRCSGVRSSTIQNERPWVATTRSVPSTLRS